MFVGLFQGISDTTSHEIHSVEEKQPTVDSATTIALNAGYLEPYTFQREEHPDHPQLRNVLFLLAADGSTLILVGKA